MFTSMQISRKIGVSFLAIVLTVAAMMTVIYWSVDRISVAARQSAAAQDTYTATLKMEMAILRQNSQVRGFLITGDEDYLKQYDEARTDGQTACRELLELLADPADQAKVGASRDRMDAWRRTWGDPLIAQTKSGDAAGAQARLRASSKLVTMTPVLKPLRELRAAQKERLADAHSMLSNAVGTSMIALALGGVVMIVVAIGFSALLSRLLARPVIRLTRVMGELAAGNNQVSIPDGARGDELGRMSQAVSVFREAAIAKALSDAEQAKVVEEVGAALGRLADADLTTRLSGFPASYGQLERDFNGAVSRLSEALQAVRQSSSGIHTGSSDISQASDDLARRTEQQAASLEETAAAMDEITATVRSTADRATSANEAVNGIRDAAERSGAVVRQAVDAMDGIERTSGEISEIISVIDGIAFQTNLLALNAGVEAARAGDAGKGFAVVASEVRALAQRSAEAAKDVKARISASSEQVEAGVRLVGETGQALTGIIERIGGVSDLVADISQAAQQQASGLHQVNTAVSEMDGVTQQNAAMVEEATAAARSLAGEADELNQQIARFRLSDRPAAPASPVHKLQEKAAAAGRRIAKAGTRVAGSTALAHADDWSEF